MTGSDRGPRIVVCLGDSITAMGWPEHAAAELERVVMINRGIPGNRLLRDGGPLNRSHGRAALLRFDDDVLATPGVTDVVVAVGTNDLGLPGDIEPLSDLPSTAQLVRGWQDLADRTAAAGLGMLLATIPPRLGSTRFDESREAIRLEVNEWVRGCGLLCLDFDAALRSATDPGRLADRYDSGDHLHPNDAGQRRLARAFLTRPMGGLLAET